MDISKLNCQTCTLLFKKDENEPRIIPICGHTICTNCITEILQENRINFMCPICEKMLKLPKENKILQFPVNRIVLDMVLEMQILEKCETHQSLLELFCVDCNKKICNRCMFNGEHRDHNVDLIENFIKNANSKRKDIQEWVTKINGQYKNIEAYIDAYHKKMTQLAEVSFDKLFKIMQEKKADSMAHIDDYFAQMKKSIGNQSRDYNKNSAVMEFRNRVDNISTFWVDNMSFSDAIRIQAEDFSKILPEVKKWVQHDNLTETKEKLKRLVLSFKTSLYTAFDDCCFIEEAAHPVLLEVSPQNSTQSSKSKNDKMDIILDKLSVEKPTNEKPSIEKPTTEKPPAEKPAIEKLAIEKPEPVSNLMNTVFMSMMEGSGTKKRPEIVVSKPLEITPTMSDIPGFASQMHEEFDNSPETPTLGTLATTTEEKMSPGAVKVNVEQLFREGKSLSEIEKLVSSNENLGNFELTLGEADVKKNVLSDFVQQLGTCVSMESLSLNFKHSTCVNDEVIKSLSGALFMLTNLKALYLDLSGCDLVSIKSASYLMEALECVQNLETFNISFEGCDRIEQEIMSKISNTIFSLKNLKTLSLNLKDCSLVGEEGLQLLSKSLKVLGTNLCEFELYLGKSNLSKEGITAIAEALTYNTKIEKLSLDFSGNYLLEEKEALEIISAISNMSKLRNLTLKFDKCLGIKTLTLTSLGQVLANLIEMKELHLALENCKSIEEEGFLSLGKAIQKLDKLETFGLFVLEASHINDASMNHIAEALQACKRMKKLYFSFDGCNDLTDNFLFTLSDSLGMMFDLDYLLLPLEDCKRITPNGLQFIFDVFSDLEKLQEINFYLGGCGWLDIDAMKKFSNALKVLKNLKVVVLDISKHISVTDDGIVALGKAFEELTNLVQLSVFLDGCKILTIEGCKRFSRSLIGLQNLKRLEVSLQNIPDIDEHKCGQIRELFAERRDIQVRVNV